MDGADSQTTLNRPAAVAVDAAANEVYVADSGNHRIVVFDADTGAYKRHWFAYGEKSGRRGGRPLRSGGAARAIVPRRDLRRDRARTAWSTSATGPATASRCSRRDGKFVKEGIVAKNTRGATVTGAVRRRLVARLGVGYRVLERRPQQRYIFVADGHDKKVRILQRDTLAEVGSFGSGGRYPGQFLAVGSIAVDAQGNLYTGETAPRQARAEVRAGAEP